MDPKTTISTPVVTQPTQPQATLNPVSDKQPLVKPLVSKKSKKSTLLIILAAFIVVVLGVATGWFLAGGKKPSVTQDGTSNVSITKEGVKEAGIGKESDYDSTAEGILKKGGVNGEGTHYLDRELGESKYVSLTSSVVNLDEFTDKKVTVWGDTISVDFKRASWKIDVGLVKEKEE